VRNPSETQGYLNGGSYHDDKCCDVLIAIHSKLDANDGVTRSSRNDGAFAVEMVQESLLRGILG
jgi:hypothetical protein